MERVDKGVQKTNVLALLAMAIAVLVIANDFTALSVALPKIENDLRADVTTAQWVINAYALVFGVLIVTGGRLADMLGRRRVFFLGFAIFALFSAIAGVAPNVESLLASRAVMGIGGAMIWPSILGMTYALLPENKAGLAGGLILGAAGFGNALGPLIGGFLSDVLSWRWIFFVNVPIAAFAMFVTSREVPADQPGGPRQKIDYAGVASLSIGLLALLVALDQGTDYGWGDPRIVSLFAVCVMSLAGFVLLERHAGTSALVPPDVMSNRNFTSACLTVLLMSAIFFAALLYLPQFMEKVLRYSALRAGAGLLPMMGTFAVTSFVAGRLYARMGPKRIVSLGAACLAIGIFLLSLAVTGAEYSRLIVGMVVLGLGVGLFYSSITTAAVMALDKSEASLAGGIVYMFQIAGGSIGLGLNTAIVITRPLEKGIETAFRVDAALAVVGVVVSLLFVGGQIHPERLRALQWHHRAHA